MFTFENSRIWKISLAPQLREDPWEEPRTRLREAFFRFRAKAATLGAEIARDLPDRTVHDITHLDALWDIADLIVGQRFPLTPPEAFVLGGAFLVHDLAMSRASYPQGLDLLQKESMWLDTVAALLRTRLGRSPTDKEIKIAPDANRATEEVLVTLHAQQAEQLPVVSWTAKDTSDHYYLD